MKKNKIIQGLPIFTIICDGCGLSYNFYTPQKRNCKCDVSKLHKKIEDNITFHNAEYVAIRDIKNEKEN